MSGKVKTVQSSKPVKTIRNVLVQPFKTKWPLVPGNDAEQFNKLFTKIPHNLMTRGMKDSVRLINEGKSCALFLSSDFHPQILGKQLIRMARRNSPTIQIVTVEKIRWSGSLERILAIPKSGSEQHDVAELLTLMTKIAKANEYEDDLCHNTTERSKLTTKQRNVVQELKPDDIARLHLPRHDCKRRTFVPEVSIFAPKSTVDTDKEEWSEYISLKRSRQDEMEFDVNLGPSKSIVGRKEKDSNKPAFVKAGTTYVPLTVNRIQGNPNRKKHNRKKAK
ncbi:uncharacterized protein LOC131683570 [Topomyia yanbarensis]|uniref:uncharacterized protein LOC131683570 n=1 Tax=Topomyia yanbarensis TaxID=2498891 RepID=UPI00273CB5D6|nr:uncharacterized protein LOC131683570 [Topomyia yanbarensis]